MTRGIGPSASGSRRLIGLVGKGVGAAAALAGTAVAATIAVRAARPGPGAARDKDAPAVDLPDSRPGIDDRLAQMIRVPTVSAEGDARAAAFDEFIERLLPQLYPRIHEHLELERVGDRGLLYRWPAAPAAAAPRDTESSQSPSAGGAAPFLRDDSAAESADSEGGDRPAILMAHFDVVPAHEEDGWSHPPFEGIVDRDAGLVRGRGALDDKGALVTLLDAVENLLADGFAPARDLYLSLGGDEEINGASARRIAALVHERGIDPWIVVDEGGAVVDPPFPGVEGRAAMVGIAEKGVLTIRLHARGRGGHASAPGRDNAIATIARALTRLRRSPFQASLTPPVRGMLEALGSSAPAWVRAVSANLWLFAPLLARGFAAATPELAAFTRTTLAVTRIEGGTADNVLPSAATATLNLRLAPGDTAESAVARIRQVVADPEIDYEVPDAHDPSPISPIDDARFALVRDAVAAAYPEATTTPYLMMQATDSREFHRFADHVYRFAPLYMSTEERRSIHGPDERVRIESLERGERFYQALIRSIPAT